MKKVSAMILLILASSAIMFVMYIITAMSLMAVVGVPLALALFAGHVWAASEVQKRFEKHGWLNKPMFLLCAGGSGIALAVLLSVNLLFANDEFGFGTVAVYLLLYSAVFTAALGIVLLTRYLCSRR